MITLNPLFKIQAGAPYMRVAYLRISKDREGGGLGVERQKYDINARRERNGELPIEKWYWDNDVSATDRRKTRKWYRLMLSDIASGVISPDATMDVWHTDRLHRQLTELEEFIDVLLPTRIKVDPVKSSPFDFSTATGRMFARQMGVQAQYYAEHMSEQIKTKKEELARKGVKLGGGRPFGYTLDGMALDGVDENGDLVGEAALIAAATDAVLAGVSLREIAHAWNEAGYVSTRVSKPFLPSEVREVLKRARNAGLMQLRGKVVGVAGWPPIVRKPDPENPGQYVADEEKFNMLLTLLDDPARNSNNGAVPRWLGTNLYVCGVCGGLLQATGAAKTGFAYICKPRPGTKRAPGERHVRRNAEALDEMVGGLIIKALTTPNIVAGIQQAAGSTLDLSAIRGEMAAIEEKQMMLGAAMADPTSSAVMIKAASASLETRFRELQAQLDAGMSNTEASALSQSADVATEWARSLERRRSILSDLAVVIVLPAPAQKGRQLRVKGASAFDPNGVRLVWSSEMRGA